MTLAGLRPGEKLFEEKLMAEEGLKKTKNKLIHMTGNNAITGLVIYAFLDGLPISFGFGAVNATDCNIPNKYIYMFPLKSRQIY